jgi:hypothetical protein
MVLDFGLMSVLLVVAHLLRARIRLLQDLYLPSAMIAGVLGFIGGRQVLNLLPFEQTEKGEAAIVGYPSDVRIPMRPHAIGERRAGGKADPPVSGLAKVPFKESVPPSGRPAKVPLVGDALWLSMMRKELPSTAW